MAFSTEVDVLTMEDIMPNVVDTVLRSNALTTRLLTKDTKKFRAATQDFPIKYQKGTATTSFIGFQTLPTSLTTTRTLMKYNPAFNESNVALATTDVAANNTLRKVLDLTEVEMISRSQDLADSIGTQFYASQSLSTDFLGLGNIVSATGTIGGLSRATYTTLQSTVTASGGTLSLFKMRTLFNNIADGEVQPTESFTDYSTWALYESLLQPQERIAKEANINPAPNFKGYTGYRSLMFAGLPITPDRKCTTGSLFFLNMDFLNFYTLDMLGGLDKGGYSGEKAKVGSKLFLGSQYSPDENFGFFWTGFIHATNALAWNSFIVVAGNLVSANPRRQGVLTGITGT